MRKLKSHPEGTERLKLSKKQWKVVDETNEREKKSAN